MAAKNIGWRQRWIRAVLAAILLAASAVWMTNQPWRTGCVVAGLALLLTAASGWCPVVTVAGMGARSSSSDGSERQ